jgi:hypothetical protein
LNDKETGRRGDKGIFNFGILIGFRIEDLPSYLLLLFKGQGDMEIERPGEAEMIKVYR